MNYKEINTNTALAASQPDQQCERWAGPEEERGETERSCSLGASQGIPLLGDGSGLPFFRGTWTIEKDKVAGLVKSPISRS